MLFHCLSYLSLLIDKKIIFINTPLQFINLIELENLNSYFHNYETKKQKIFLCSSSKNEILKINFIKKKISLNKYQIINSSNKFKRMIIWIILNLRKLLFSKIPLLIIGDYNFFFFLKFMNISKKVIILDDGTSTLDFKKKTGTLKTLNNNYYFFSFFEKNILKIKKYIYNDFLFLKQQNKNKLKKNFIIILGSPAVERKFLTKYQYFFYLKKISKIYSNYKIYYFPHPKENIENYRKFKFFTIVKSLLPFELYLIFSPFIPFAIIGWNSTSFIIIKKIFKSNLKLFNYHLNIKIKDRLQIYSTNFLPRFLKIMIYFKNYLHIRTKVITIKDLNK